MLQSFVQGDIDLLSYQFSENIQEDIVALSGQEIIVIGLSGGTSLNVFYENLKNMFLGLPHETAIKIRFVFLDERIVPLSDIESNFHSVGEAFFYTLLDSGVYQRAQIITIDLDMSDIARVYSGRVPHIDIALFGVGEDGHIASLFPYHSLLTSEDNGFLEIIDSPKPPSHRITISPEMIRMITYAYIFFIGEKKKAAYVNFLSPEKGISDCPAKLILQSKQYMSFSDIMI